MIPEYLQSTSAFLELAPCSRVMSLRDANQKMSKSDPLDSSRINLNDSPDLIADKIRRAKTDSITEVNYY